VVWRFFPEGEKMKCIYCGGDMVRGKTPYHFDEENIHIILDEVPAWVCRQCGEVYFEETDVDSIQEFIQTVKKQADKIHRTTA
jgi:YgiT-type zinc finger domain-containing protein